MRIDRTTPAKSATTRRAGRADAAFTMPEDASDAMTAPATTTLLPLAVLREDETGVPPVAPDAPVAAQCRAVLGALAGLQLATLGGAGNHARQTLADLARTLPRAADPGLNDVLQAIAQRAAIEVARAG